MRPAHVLAIAIAALLAACGTGAEAEPATISATTTTGPASTTITTTTTSAATGDAADAGYDEEMEELSERYENDPEYRAEMDALADAAIDSMYEREVPAMVTSSVEGFFDLLSPEQLAARCTVREASIGTWTDNVLRILDENLEPGRTPDRDEVMALVAAVHDERCGA